MEVGERRWGLKEEGDGIQGRAWACACVYVYEGGEANVNGVSFLFNRGDQVELIRVAVSDRDGMYVWGVN